MQKINGIIIMSSGVVSIMSPHKPWDNRGFWASVSWLMGTHALHSNSMNQVESILQITTVLRNGHLNYNSHITTNLVVNSTQPSNSVLKGKNIDLGWF